MRCIFYDISTINSNDYEKICYGRGLPTYMIADIKKEDIIFYSGQFSQNVVLDKNTTLYKDGGDIRKTFRYRHPTKSAINIIK